MGVRSCCCFRLDTGGLILGWLGVIGGVISVISSFFMYINFDTFYVNLNGEDISNQGLAAVKYCIGTAISCYVVGILINCALIYGIAKKEKLMLIPWLICHLMEIVFIALFALCGLLGFIFIHDEKQILFVLVFLFCILSLLVEVYFWICIHSLYNHFKHQERNVQENMTVLEAAPPNVGVFDSYIPYTKM